MSVIYQCDRCKTEIRARSHYAAEVKWSEHRCDGMRPLSELPLDLLRELAYKRITETQAWELFAKRGNA